jgi:DNA-binding transcriptional LysR family regulator
MKMDIVGRRVTLRELRLFLAVARSGSVVKAANEIGLTQPALSKSIAELERTFGVRLFDRTNRGVTPTPHGEVLLRRATGVFEELRQAVDEFETLTDASRGELRLGGTPTMCAGLLPRAITSVLNERPKFRFHVAELESAKVRSEVSTRSLDVGMGREQVAGENDDLVFDRLFDDRLFIVAGARHQLAGRRSTTLEEAACQQWVLPTTEGSVTAQFVSELRKAKLELPQPAVTTMSVLVRYELIATNSFLTVMHGSVLRFGNVPKFLRVLPIDLPTGIPVGILRLKNRTLTPSAEFFIAATGDMVRPMQSLSAKQLRREMHAEPWLRLQK